MLIKTRLLTPGPTPLPEEVRLAMARDMIHHRKPGFKAVLAEVQEGLRYLFETNQPVITLASSGTGAMDAAVSNLFAPGEKVLCAEGGKFGERWLDICRTYGVVPVHMPVEWGHCVDPRAVRAALDADPAIRGVCIQASETSTGVLHPVRELGEVTRERDALLVVDGISAVGVSPCPMDAWHMDCLLTGSQKGIMLPPGLSFVALSERAWAKAATVPSKNFYFQLAGEREAVSKDQTMFTPAISLIVGLRESLALFRESGRQSVFRKQWALTCMVRTAAQAMGLELFAKQGFTWGLTSIRMPLGVSAAAVAKTSAEEFGVVMTTGQGEFKDKIIRMGHMGHVDYGDILAGLAAFRIAFERAGGYVGCDTVLEQAMAAHQTAMQAGPPAL